MRRLKRIDMQRTRQFRIDFRSDRHTNCRKCNATLPLHAVVKNVVCTASGRELQNSESEVLSLRTRKPLVAKIMTQLRQNPSAWIKLTYLMNVFNLETRMAMRQKMPVAPNVNGRKFPPEAQEYQSEVPQKEIDALKTKIGIDFSTDEWEVVDGFGQIVHA
jgi:hypothetical protein